MLDEQDRTVYENRLPNDLATIINVLCIYQAELSACVVESTYNWYWLVDRLMSAGFPVQLAHTSALPQYEGLKYSNDFLDARQLAHLVPLGILPHKFHNRGSPPLTVIYDLRGLIHVNAVCGLSASFCDLRNMSVIRAATAAQNRKAREVLTQARILLAQFVGVTCV